MRILPSWSLGMKRKVGSRVGFTTSRGSPWDSASRSHTLRLAPPKGSTPILRPEARMASRSTASATFST